jgi:hypothetical protein
VWDGTQFVSISSPIAAVPNAVSSYSSSAPASRTTRTNLVTNPSFEVDTNGWSGAQSLSRSTAFQLYGAASLAITMASTTDNNIAVVTPTVTVGMHCLSAYFYIPAGSALAGRTVTWSIEGGTATTTTPSVSSLGTLVAGSWVRASLIRNVTAAGTMVSVARISGSLASAVGLLVYTDGALVEQSSTLNPYFDGTTYQTIPEAYPSSILTAWTGTANASTSTISYYKQSDVKVGQLWVDSDDMSLYVYDGANWTASKTISSINLNSNVISTDYTMVTGYNGASTGPITIDLNKNVVVGIGSTWSII